MNYGGKALAELCCQLLTACSLWAGASAPLHPGDRPSGRDLLQSPSARQTSPYPLCWKPPSGPVGRAQWGQGSWLCAPAGRPLGSMCRGQSWGSFPRQAYRCFVGFLPSCPQYTLNGKKVEVAVKHIIAGKPVEQRGAFSNPETLDLYRNIPELQGF